jgi:8-oxo-dGTP pyrophosphatase MutT (NUDIX family)
MSSFITLRALASPVSFGVCALVLDRDGRILLVRHTYQPGWMLPGGAARPAEPPSLAIMRELREEVGLTRAREPEFFSLYTRRAGWATNIIALYRVADAEIAFRPNIEVAETVFASPDGLPEGTTAPTVRRIREHVDELPPAHYW